MQFFNPESTQKSRKKRGHPPNSISLKLSIQLWYYELLERLGFTKAQDVEKYYVTHQDDYKGGFRNSNKFRLYEQGKYSPSLKIVSWFEDRPSGKFRGTEKILYNPFWTLLDNPALSNEKLFDLLYKLPPDIAVRLTKPNRALTYFLKQSSLDALAGCLWLICQVRHDFSSPPFNQYYPAISTAFEVFFRLATKKTYLPIAEELFNCLKNNFLPIDKNDKFLHLMNKIDCNSGLNLNLTLLNIVNELSILKTFKEAPPSCLYLVHKKLTNSVIEKIMPLIKAGKWRQVQQNSDIKKLKYSLKRWEKLQRNNN